MNNFLSIHLIEVSEVLSNIQAEKLGVTIIPNEEDSSYYKRGKTVDNVEVFWYKSLSRYRYRRFSLIVAHEFFDALPIHKFKVRITNYSHFCVNFILLTKLFSLEN